MQRGADLMKIVVCSIPERSEAEHYEIYRYIDDISDDFKVQL